MATHRLGWLEDRVKFPGGAELEAATLLNARPDWAEIVPCAPGDVTPHVDAYIIHNCTQYSADIVPTLMMHPVIKRVHDVWHDGDPALRSWLLAKSRRVLLSSKLHLKKVHGLITARLGYVPSAVTPPSPLPIAAERNGYAWIGRMWPGKGLLNVKRWAERNNVLVDCYGFGPDVIQCTGNLTYRGPLSQDAVWETLGKYKGFVHLPTAAEPYGRTVAEAFIMGCELTVNGNIGAVEWIENRPEAVANGAALFWQAVGEALNV